MLPGDLHRISATFKAMVSKGRPTKCMRDIALCARVKTKGGLGIDLKTIMEAFHFGRHGL